jgi:CRISPR-associated exonuclease Cas4
MPDLEPIALSALQHYAYCPRQCALIHVERVWSDNAQTAQGTHLHARADDAGTELLEGTRMERALPLFHDALGLAGRADVVEFLLDGTPFPVEYKSGKRKRSADPATAALEQLCDDVQLCAQAMCLAAMFETPVPRGAIFHAGSRRRRDVAITPALRERTLEVIQAVREQLQSGVTPAPVNDARCTHCSLNNACLPSVRDLSKPDPFKLEGAL